MFALPIALEGGRRETIYTLIRKNLVTTLAVLVGSIVWAGAAPAQDPAPLTGVTAPGPIAAYDGRLVWSRPDGAGGYELVQRVANGPIVELPIKPRAVPFDVDLGPTSGGRVMAVYTRCATEPKPALDVSQPGGVAYGTGKGCDVYKLDVQSGQEVALHEGQRRRRHRVLAELLEGSARIRARLRRQAAVPLPLREGRLQLAAFPAGAGRPTRNPQHEFGTGPARVVWQTARIRLELPLHPGTGWVYEFRSSTSERRRGPSTSA